MSLEILYAFVAVVLISLVSLLGTLFIFIREKALNAILVGLIGLSAGALLGDAFFHLLPDGLRSGFTLQLAIFILIGIFISLILERTIHWHHHRTASESHKHHVHPMGIMNLYSDAVHNFIDGLIIGGSFLIDVRAGIATSIAVLFHEIPHELGDLAVLLKSGLKLKKAILFHFLTSVASLLGVAVAFALSASLQGIPVFLILFATGNFIYIAMVDLIPELHREASTTHKYSWDILFFLIGIGIMAALLAAG